MVSFPLREPRGHVRLCCVLHAETGAAAYLLGASGLPRYIEACGVESGRMAEPLHRRTEPLAAVSWTRSARGSRCLQNGLWSAVAGTSSCASPGCAGSSWPADDFLSLPWHIVADEDLVALVRPILRRFGTHRNLTVTGKGPQRRCPVTVFAGVHDEPTPLSALGQLGRRHDRQLYM